jgi:uncharacterized protein
MKAVIAGGSGFVGKHLAAELTNSGFEVVVLTRSPNAGAKFREVKWDGKSQGDWAKEIDGATAVFNLSGAPIDKKWTPEYQKVLVSSRTEPTRAIHEAIRASAVKPKTWVNASAVGWYGDRGDEILSESDRIGEGFLSEVCQQWEDAALVQDIPEVKQVCARIGIVLGNEGGVLGALIPLVKGFAGGAAGSGKQYLSVIHVKDLAKMLVWLVEAGQEGPINACGPEPVTNSQLMAALRERFGRPPVPPAPAFVIKAATAAMGKEATVVLVSQRAVPTLALAQGFEFAFPTLNSALDDLLS